MQHATAATTIPNLIRTSMGATEVSDAAIKATCVKLNNTSCLDCSIGDRCSRTAVVTVVLIIYIYVTVYPSSCHALHIPHCDSIDCHLTGYGVLLTVHVLVSKLCSKVRTAAKGGL